MCWTIRSQDHETLLNAQVLWIEPVIGKKLGDSNQWAIQTKVNIDINFPVGTFPTPEKALEELNRIHDWIALSNGVGVYQVGQP